MIKFISAEEAGKLTIQNPARQRILERCLNQLDPMIRDRADKGYHTLDTTELDLEGYDLESTIEHALMELGYNVIYVPARYNPAKTRFIIKW